MIRDFFLGFIKIHFLHHAAEEPVYGAWLIETDTGDHELHEAKEKMRALVDEVIDDRASPRAGGAGGG